MALTVRLKPATERTLNALAKRRNLSRSDMVREAIEQYGKAEPDLPADRPYHAWEDVIGVVALGARDASRTTGEQFVDLVKDRKRARRTR